MEVETLASHESSKKNKKGGVARVPCSRPSLPKKTPLPQLSLAWSQVLRSGPIWLITPGSSSWTKLQGLRTRREEGERGGDEGDGGDGGGSLIAMASNLLGETWFLHVCCEKTYLGCVLLSPLRARATSLHCG